MATSFAPWHSRPDSDNRHIFQDAPRYADSNSDSDSVGSDITQHIRTVRSAPLRSVSFQSIK